MTFSDSWSQALPRRDRNRVIACSANLWVGDKELRMACVATMIFTFTISSPLTGRCDAGKQGFQEVEKKVGIFTHKDMNT